MTWCLYHDATRLGLLVAYDCGRPVAEGWPVLRATAFGDYQFTVTGRRDRARSQEEAKAKVEKLLNQNDITPS